MSSNGAQPLTLSHEELMQHIVGLLRGKKRGKSYQCHCPAHDDKRASLSLDLYGDEVLPVRQVRMVSFTPRRYSVTKAEMPAYEARIRQDVLGERLAIRQ